MKRKHSRKPFAIFMIAFLLFWSALPAISMAYFITPGNAITPGDAITGGKAITGGQFIIPGQVITPGTTYQGGPFLQGGDSAISGQPIIPPYQSSNGQFIIPNIAGSLPINNPIVAGDAITGGDAPSGGEAVNSGDPAEGGTSTSSGEAVNGGDASSTGDALTGGDPAQGGEGQSGGDALTGGESQTGGDAVTGGDGSTSGDSLTGGDPAQGGEGVSGGDGSSTGTSLTGGSSTEGGSSPTGGDVGNNGSTEGGTSIPFFSRNDSERGIVGEFVQDIKDTRRYVLSFGKTFVEGMSATYAGFDFRQLKSGNYKVVGKSSLKNPVLNYFYHNYKKYTLDGRDAYMPAGKSNPKPYRVDTFLDSKKFANFSSPSSFISSSWKNVKSSVNDGFNVLSKKFWSASNMMKLNGPINLAASAFNSVYDYGWGSKSDQGFASSNFAADLTVDVAVGAGTTALSAVLSSAAAGAVAGSAVPGLGTAVGAVVGLGAGLISTYLINGTEPGRRAKQWVSDKLSQGYSKVADGAKGLFNGAKKLFGFG